MAAQSGSGPPALYLTGSDGDDAVVASYAARSRSRFTAGGSPAGTCPSRSSRLDPPRRPRRQRQPHRHRLPETTSVILLGGEGGDQLTGGATEDALVDGAGNDSVAAGGGDDAVPNNGGADQLDAGPGEDLFISNAVCDGDSLDGGADRDNANWANFDTGGRDRPGRRTARAWSAAAGSRAARAATLDASRGDRGHRGNEPRRRHGRRRRRQPAARQAGAGHLPRRRRQTTRSSPTPATASTDPDPTIDCGDGSTRP